MDEKARGPVKAIVLGAGYRGRAYAAYATAHPDRLEIVGVADPEQAPTIRSPRYWGDWRECLLARPDADLAFITLPDALHHQAAIMALDVGYNLLLEKPLATTEAQCRQIIDMANAKGLLVITGHVLRHTRYFAHIKAIIDSGTLGEVVSIAHQESAGYFKAAHSLCRGNWANAAKSSPIILQKCSHDFDLFAWWLGRRCRRVSSFGSISLFRKENRPDGAAERCEDCPGSIEQGCIWSARRMYLGEDSKLGYMFADTSREAMERVVRETDFGRCVYACDNDVPDHQVVSMEFEGGATVSLVMAGFTEHNVRTTRISCTRGEIVGDGSTLHICRFGDNKTWDISHDSTGAGLSPLAAQFPGAATSAPEPSSNESRHGGGDFNLVTEALHLMKNGSRDAIKAVTEQSLESHLIAFAAEESRLNGGKVVELK